MGDLKAFGDGGELWDNLMVTDVFCRFTHNHGWTF